VLFSELSAAACPFRAPQPIDTFVLVTSRALYLTRHQTVPNLSPVAGKPHPLSEFYALDLCVPVTEVAGITVTKLADNFLFLHVKPRAPQVGENVLRRTK
jgi:hypothetical protein